MSGRVVAPEGRALTDCFVEALLLPFFSSCGERVQVTGEGTFELSGLTTGGLFIEASAPGFAASSSAPFEATAGTRVTEVVVRLSEGGALSGRVIDARADPIAGANVIAFDRFDFRAATLTARPRSQTDEDGRFTLQHVPAEHCSLEVQVAGYAVRIVNDISPEEGKTTDLHSVALCRGATISGAVLGLGGAPVPGASAQLMSTSPWSSLGTSTRADDAGRFRIEHVTPGSYMLGATRPDDSTSDPFQFIGDMKRSQTEIDVADGESYAFDLRIEFRDR